MMRTCTRVVVQTRSALLSRALGVPSGRTVSMGLAETMRGKTEASTTRTFFMPMILSSGSTTAKSSVTAPILQVPAYRRARARERKERCKKVSATVCSSQKRRPGSTERPISAPRLLLSIRHSTHRVVHRVRDLPAILAQLLVRDDLRSRGDLALKPLREGGRGGNLARNLEAVDKSLGVVIGGVGLRGCFGEAGSSTRNEGKRGEATAEGGSAGEG